MKYDKYTILLETHTNEYKTEIEKLKAENHKLNKKIDHLNYLMACYRSRISDLEDILEGE